jgi:asparagine synthase (glutamine-hydrolysing)
MNMNYTFRSVGDGCVFDFQQQGLLSISDYGCEIYGGGGIAESRLQEFLDAYRDGILTEVLDGATEHRFFVCIVDNTTKRIVVINDKFGSNEIYYTHNAQGWAISNRIANVIGNDKPNIDMQGLYESLFLYSIAPPRTIYEGVSSVPMATVLTIDCVAGTHTSVRYWDIEHGFKPKNMNYEEHVKNIRTHFFNAVEEQVDATTGVSLSGGIDSGTLLAMATQVRGGPVQSITFGGHGKSTPDLVEGSRITAHEFNYVYGRS